MDDANESRSASHHRLTYYCYIIFECDRTNSFNPLVGNLEGYLSANTVNIMMAKGYIIYYIAIVV